jgi:hypothetical protein
LAEQSHRGVSVPEALVRGPVAEPRVVEALTGHPLVKSGVRRQTNCVQPYRSH